MKYEIKDVIGINGFNKIFELKKELKKEIENYKNQKTVIHFEFKSFSKNKKEFKKLEFPPLNKEFPIEKKIILLLLNI